MNECPLKFGMRDTLGKVDIANLLISRHFAERPMDSRLCVLSCVRSCVRSCVGLCVTPYLENCTSDFYDFLHKVVS